MKGVRLTDKDKETTINTVAMVISRRTQRPIAVAKAQLYDQYINLTSSQKMNFWNEVSHITGFDVQQMYKYFVNTWSKDVFEEFTPELRKFVTIETIAAFAFFQSQLRNRKQLINVIWEKIKQQIGNKNLHLGQVYAFVHHTFTRCLNTQHHVDIKSFILRGGRIPTDPRSLQLHLSEINNMSADLKASYAKYQSNESKDSLNILQQCIMHESISIKEDFNIVVSILGAME